eukprot:1306084-Rhodomonas_salina.2
METRNTTQARHARHARHSPPQHTLHTLHILHPLHLQIAPQHLNILDLTTSTDATKQVSAP